MVIADFTEDRAVAGEFLDEFVERCAQAGDFMRFLCDAARVAY
jgi:hypothetical protein